MTRPLSSDPVFGKPLAAAPVRRTPEELLDAARSAVMAGRLAEARAMSGEVLRGLPRTGDAPTIAAEALRVSARSFHIEGNAEAALDCLEAALAVCTASGDDGGAGQALNNAGIVHLQLGQLDDAERLFGDAMARARVANSGRVRAFATMHLGIVSTVRGDLQLALSHYQSALAEYRAAGLVRDVAATLNNMGMLHVDLGQWAEAERVYAEASSIITGIGDLDALALMHVNLAEMWVARGDTQNARKAVESAMDVCGRTTHSAGIGDAHKMFGVVAREQGAYAEAEQHLDRARENAESRGDLLLKAETAREQAELFRRQGRNADTLKALNSAHKLFEALRARRDLADIGRRVGRIEDEFVEVARRWGESIEAKDRYTQGHCKRVADLSCMIAEEAGLDEQSLFWFRIGALLHDVGKLVIPEEVLNKPGKLSDEEWALMRSHTVAGVDMLSGIEFPWDVRPIVLSHHERWDGKGYPNGLQGEDIPFVARILCVADVYDALTSVRSYKRALSHDEAMAILRKDIGTAFDPAVFEKFEKVAPAWAPRTAEMQRLAAAELMAGPDALPLPPGHDPLTRLPLAPLVHAECGRLLSSRGAAIRTVAVLVVTIDAADALARRQSAGAAPTTLDELRRRVADALCRNTRGGDFVGRLADDEFAVLLPDTQPSEARGAADRLRDAATGVLAAPRPTTRSTHVRIGVAVAPGQGRTADTLFAAARESAAQAAATSGMYAAIDSAA
ncbi:metal dependent phosphohydrolase [Gemmatirosa kalamazoonensis]|uniref:Metal dependent phosphohydrolase n=1 Tax=Gemmatirosa kalamazoonensis TaxID=861299 RepID=W0RLS2_9BACT|nr:HD domain-containing phosphohydrolase [Gemmatirosa kalamazoonensis]AHG91260.1 metal dependent phosphohydrolase [Gemmatirosa kalamazoonensis]